MRKIVLISVIIISLLTIVALAGAAVPAEQARDGAGNKKVETTPYKVYAEDSSLKAFLKVRHEFPGVFTADLTPKQVKTLKDNGIKVEKVKIYYPLKKPGTECGNGVCEPSENKNNCPQDCGESTDSGISVSWVNPTDGETVSGTVTIQIDASDSDGSIQRVEWNIDDGTWNEVTLNSTTGYYEDSWDTTGASEGGHTLTANATDNEGNSKTTSISVTVDNEAGEPRVSDQIPYGIEQIYNDSSVTATSGGNGIDIALLDTGVDTDHPDLVNRLEQCVDFTGGGPFNTKIEEGSCEDKDGHGTHTAGTALADAGSDDLGIYGVAPEADLFAYKVCGGRGCYTDDIAAAIDYAGSHDAEVVSMSLGGDSQSSLIRDAIDRNKDKIVFVAAAGNDGPNLETMDYPGADPDVIGVAAIDSNYRVPDFSSRGVDDDTFVEAHKYVEVAAAGVNVLSCWNDGTYNTISGTSMATPHISGFAAKVWASGKADSNGDGTTTPDEVRSYIQDRASYTDITKGIYAGNGYDPAAGIGLPTVE